MIEKEIPLIKSMYTSLDLTEFGKNQNRNREPDYLTKTSKVEIKNHYSHDFMDVDKKMDLSRHDPLETITNLPNPH